MELKTVNPVVFDDPNNCGVWPEGTSNVEKTCDFLDSNICVLFKTALNMEERPGYFYHKKIKCQECKDHYQKAIEAEKIETDHRTQHQKQMDKHLIGH